MKQRVNHIVENKHIRKIGKHKSKITVAIVLLSLTPSCFAVDLLAGVMGPIAATFGPGTVFYKLIIAAEVASSAFLYHKSKNPVVFLGVPLLSIVLTYFLGQYLVAP